MSEVTVRIVTGHGAGVDPARAKDRRRQLGRRRRPPRRRPHPHDRRRRPPDRPRRPRPDRADRSCSSGSPTASASAACASAPSADPPPELSCRRSGHLGWGDGEDERGPAEATERRHAGDAAPGRLDRPPAPRRQARPAGARGAAAEAHRGGRVHARRLGLPRRLGRPRRRRGPGRLPRLRASASCARRPGSSCRPRRSSSPSAAGSPRRSSRAASTPGSSSPSPPPTRRPRSDGVGDRRRALVRARRGARRRRGRRDRPRLPDPHPARLAGRAPDLGRRARRLPRPLDRADRCRSWSARATSARFVLPGIADSIRLGELRELDQPAAPRR